MTWSTFPWASVGAAVSVVGLGLMALRLAVLWGAIKQHIEDLERRLTLAEGEADGVPDKVDHEVSSRYRFIEGAVKALAHKLGQLYKATRHLKRQQDLIHSRCQDEHGLLPEVSHDQIDDVLSSPPDDEESEANATP